MTQRERHASPGLSATVPTPHALPGTTGQFAHLRSSSAVETSSMIVSLWEDVFHKASPAQQEELLTLASRQGLLYAYQLPRSNGTAVHASPADDARGFNLLSRLLQGQHGELPPIQPRPVTVSDPVLDERQREAVARALDTPDVCLIQGLPGTGKSRVIAEIVTQAAARGDRVLLVAPGTAAIDRVLDLVNGREAICSLRCLAQGERPDDLLPAARAATLPERARTLRAHALTEAVRAREQAELRCQRLHDEETAWPRLQQLAERERAAATTAASLSAQSEQVPAEVRVFAENTVEVTRTSEDGDFAGAVVRAATVRREALARVQEGIGRCEKESAERTREIEALTAELEALRPLAEAKNGGRWWSGAWWRATFHGGVPSKFAELEKGRDTARAALERLEGERKQLEQERTVVEETFQTEKQKQIAEETARRLAALEAQQASLRAERAAIAATWQKTCALLEHEALWPAEMSAEAVATAKARWESRCKEDEQHCTFARQWAAYLEQSAESLATRLPGYANLVAVTISALPTDEHFGDAAASGGSFDLLILDEAEQVTEAELLKLTRRARRWALVGEPSPAPESPQVKGRGHGRPTPSPALARGQVFQRLWQSLHCDPSQLPYAWSREGERLCCRLRQLAPEQRQWLESERVADCLDVELRILSSPRIRPLLAEVIFPSSMTVAQAKEYIYRELQELPVLASGRSPRWIEEPDRVLLALSDVGSAEVESIALEPGVRELIVSGDAAPAHTCRLEFDRQAGWDRARAEEWVESRLRLRDLGRTARLDVVYRMAPALCEVLADLVFEGACRMPSQAEGLPPMGLVEFVAVPPLTRKAEPVHAGRERGRRRGAVATRSEPRTQQGTFPRAGAGLEQDLSATGHSDRLPVELRNRLPRRGFVNYAEAQAVVRWLEDFSAKHSDEAPSVAVIALYGAQADLIRLLIQQSARLAQSTLRIEIDSPAAFRQREFLHVLVSLTRSHSHRAVSFGEDPQQLTLALTRARSRLVVFGDPGTLARRGQWNGVLDHLDEAAAAREGLVIGNLLSYLQGVGHHGRAFRFCEGGAP